MKENRMIFLCLGKVIDVKNLILNLWKGISKYSHIYSTETTDLIMDLEKEGAYTDSGSLILTPWDTLKSDWNVLADETEPANVEKKQNLLELVLFVLYLTFFLILFYLFSCSLLLFGLACRLMSVNAITAIFSSAHLENTLVSVSIGNLASSFIQSIDCSLALIISLLDNKRIDFQNAIPLIFGCNIGCTMMSVLFTVMHINSRYSFRRAVGSAALTTAFNFWAVMILLPIEKITGFHYHIITSLVEILPKVDEIKYNYGGIVRPAVDRLFQIDDKLWQGIVSSNRNEITVSSVVKRWCPETNSSCQFPFDFLINDLTQGLVMCIIALPLIILFAFLMMACIRTLLVISFTKSIRNFLSSFRVTSCSIGGFVSTLIGFTVMFLFVKSITLIILLNFLVGGRFISVPLAYPFVLGINLGTSLQAALRCLTTYGVTDNVLYVTLCNLLFNIDGIVILYSIPWPRLPLLTAEYLGDWAYSHRAFSVIFFLMWFILLPLLTIMIAYVSIVSVVLISAPIFVIVFISFIIYHMQLVCPQFLPGFLRTWRFMPIWLRSVAPYERCFNFRRLKILKSKGEGESVSDVFQYMESKPGESISVVMNRIRKESIFQPTNILLKQAVDTTGTQFSISKLAKKKSLPSTNQLPKGGFRTVDQSSSEGSLIAKYTPFQSGAGSSVDVRTKDSIDGTSTSSSVKILTPYSTSKFKVIHHPKSQKKISKTSAADSYVSITESKISVVEEVNEPDSKVKQKTEDNKVVVQTKNRKK